MSFVKHTWVTGELVTAVLLNRIEDFLETISEGEDDATDADCDALFDNFLKD